MVHAGRTVACGHAAHVVGACSSFPSQCNLCTAVVKAKFPLPEGKETTVQAALSTLFDELKERTGSTMFVHDTSLANYLTNPTAKVDFTFTYGTQVH